MRAKRCLTAPWVRAASASLPRSCGAGGCLRKAWRSAARDAFGNLIGTVRLWNVVSGNGVPALLLGPLAVAPDHKGAGVGSALMRHAIEEATRLEHGAILLVGDAPYYARFGFSAEKTGNMSMPGPFEKARFLGLELKPGALEGAAGTLAAAGRKLQAERVRVAA